MTANKIRLIPAISAAAFRAKKSHEVALWYCLRWLDSTGANGGPGGNGVLENKATALAAIMQFLGYSQATLYRHFQAGEGIFWETDSYEGHTRIKIYGLKRVAEYLDTRLDFERRFREIAVENFNTSSRRKAQLYASIHNPDGVKGNPRSRAFIRQMTTLSRATQIRHERRAGVRRIGNYATLRESYHVQGKSHVDADGVQRFDIVRVPDDTPFSIERTAVKNAVMQVRSKSRTFTIARRLPNSYRSKQQAGSTGMLRKVSKSLRARSFLDDEAQTPTRLYFPTFRTASNALAQGDSTLVYARATPNWRVIKGRQEWALCQS